MKPNAVLSISHARIFVFHGTKQIQMDFKRSKVYEEHLDFKVNEDYNFSGRRAKEDNRRE